MANRAAVGGKSDDLAAWADLGRVNVKVFDAPPVENHDFERIEPGNNILLVLSIPNNRKKFGTDLTLFTAEELSKFRDILNLACDLAMPLCEARDTEAQRALKEEGDDRFARLFRPVPVLVDRARIRKEHGAGVRRRSPDIAELGRSPGVAPVPRAEPNQFDLDVPVFDNDGPDEFDAVGEDG